MTIRDRRDSFCGKMSVCNYLKQYGFLYSFGRYIEKNMIAVDVSGDHRATIVGSAAYFKSSPKPCARRINRPLRHTSDWNPIGIRVLATGTDRVRRGVKGDETRLPTLRFGLRTPETEPLKGLL